MEYRAIAESEREAFRHLVDQAFYPEQGPREYDSTADLPTRLSERRGLFEDGRLRCICSHYFHTASIRGEWWTVGGVATVATPPEYRRRGYVSRILRETLREYRERDAVVSALWPFDHGFYRQYGWAMSNRAAAYRLDPSALAFAREATDGEHRRLDLDDWRTLRSVRDAVGADLGLTIRPGEGWWRERVFRRWDGSAYVYAWERDGTTGGYLVYTVADTGEGRELRVRDICARDHDAYLNLLALLSNHDAQTDIVTLERPAGSDLLDLVPDPEAVECRIEPGPSVRIVDVARALERLPYPENLNARVTLDVTDGFAEWNDGLFRLSVDDGTATCRQLPEGDGAAPDVETDVGTLSQVLVGYHGIETAKRVGSLAVDGDDTGATLAGLFPPRRVYLRDFF
ncbi:GNAT family N-acetyltransferase [Halobacteriales archaeon QS_1_68_17]|nr:MAG: GNAT family N-acetyltransferase [Halobacteriales archaeon QS_1_68_17]